MSQQDKLLRVTQLNAAFLDGEFFKTIYQLLQDTTKHLPPGLTAPFDPELHLLVKLAILYNSIYKNGSTFGQQMLSIKYTNMSHTKKILYIVFSTLDYLKQRFEYWRPSHKLNDTIYKIHMAILLMKFVNMSIFLRRGSKPLIIERLLCLDQVFAADSAPRQFESKYLARELLWNGFIDILIHVLPLINYHKIKRTIKTYNPFHKKSNYVSLDTSVMTMNSKCAHCGDSPILPHHMGCAHVFCYVCLKGNQAADAKYECPICEHKNLDVLCERVAVV